MVSDEASTVVYITLQIVTILVFAVGVVLAVAGRVRPGQRGLFGAGCGLNILGNAFYFLLYLPNSFSGETVFYLLVSSVGTVLGIVGVVLIVIAACRRPGPPAYPYAAVPGQPYGYPPPWTGPPPPPGPR